MKKLSFFLTILICFGLIACDNAGTKAKVGRDGDITVEKLIAGMPTSIEEFEVGPAIHESFPCYVTTSDSKSVINIESPFSFTKTDDTLAAIAKLDAYVAETYTENFTKALVSAEEIDEIKSAIVAWLAEISE